MQYLLLQIYVAFLMTVLIHEIGHLIHFAIEENHWTYAKKWSQLWHDVYKRAGSPKDPIAYIGKHCNSRSCPFLGWKDADNEREGFANLVEVIVRKQNLELPKHPDYIMKWNFINELIEYSKQKFP